MNLTSFEIRFVLFGPDGLATERSLTEGEEAGPLGKKQPVYVKCVDCTAKLLWWGGCDP